MGLWRWSAGLVLVGAAVIWSCGKGTDSNQGNGGNVITPPPGDDAGQPPPPPPPPGRGWGPPPAPPPPPPSAAPSSRRRDRGRPRLGSRAAGRLPESAS